MMDISFAILFFALGFVAGALIKVAWTSDSRSIADHEPSEHGRSPL